MTRRWYVTLIVLLSLLILCTQAHALVDPNATAETVALYNTINTTTKTMVGLHEPYWWGSLDWDTMDCWNITNKFPKVAEFDMDDSAVYQVQRHNRNDGISILNWHMDNPMTDHSGSGDAWDATGTITRILPGGADRATYTASVNQTCGYIRNMTDENGNAIPVVLRIFHENDGAWFFWGTTVTSDANYISLWRDFVNQTITVNGLHNVLFEYSPQIINGYTTYNGTRYPGDAYVDICGVSWYDDSDDLSATHAKYNTTKNCAVAIGKPWVISEGHRQLVAAAKDNYWSWYFNALWAANLHPAYALFWNTHYSNPSVSYGPVVGRATEAADFYNMTNQTNVTTITDTHRVRMWGIRTIP